MPAIRYADATDEMVYDSSAWGTRKIKYGSRTELHDLLSWVDKISLGHVIYSVSGPWNMSPIPPDSSWIYLRFQYMDDMVAWDLCKT